MGRKLTITQFEFCKKHTDKNKSAVFKVLKFKQPDRANVLMLRWEFYTGTSLDNNNITLFNIAKFKEHCYADMSPNSVATSCAWLASAIRISLSDEGKNPQKFCEALLCKREQGTFAWLTNEEMDKFVEFYKSTENNNDRAIVALAIIEFYTAARTSDTKSFSEANVLSQMYIDKNTKEIKQADMICYTSKKTNVKASIPIKPIVRKILEDSRIKGIVITTCVFNAKIKEIAKQIGLDRPVTEHRLGKDIKDRPLHECLSSHSFRRSFATVLQRDGVSIDLVAKMMGHTNHMQTMRYVQSDTLVMEDNALKFFK